MQVLDPHERVLFLNNNVKNGVLDPYTSLLPMQNTDKVKFLNLQS